MPDRDRSKKPAASKDRSRTPPRVPKAVPPGSKAAFLGADRRGAPSKAGCERGRCQVHGNCEYDWCPLRDLSLGAPGAGASAARGGSGCALGRCQVPGCLWPDLALDAPGAGASAARGGSIPQTRCEAQLPKPGAVDDPGHRRCEFSAACPCPGPPGHGPTASATPGRGTPGGSTPQTPAPAPSSCQTTTTTTNALGADGEMITVVTTRTTIITTAPGVNGPMESRAASSTG